MTTLHLILALKIFWGAVAGLIAVAYAFRTVRIWLHGKDRQWNPSVDIATAIALAAKENWLHRALAAFDIAFNVIFLRGQQDETISTHSYRAAVEGKLWGKLMTKWLCWFQSNHGQRAACGDLERAQVRVAVLTKLLLATPPKEN